MTDLLCSVCDYDILNDKIELNNYLATQRKKDDKSITKQDIINNIDLNEFDKILNSYVNIHNKKFDIYFIKCKFKIAFDNITSDLESNIVYNKESYKIKFELLFSIDYMGFDGRNFRNFNHMSINIFSDICNMTHDYYTYRSLNPLER